VLERCGFVHYDNPRAGGRRDRRTRGKVLLARNKAWPETWYALVAGFLERGEDPAMRCRREVREELGWTRFAHLVGVYPFDMRNEVLIVYHVRTSGPSPWATNWWT
jgi:NAD+ diphosphatase